MKKIVLLVLAVFTVGMSCHEVSLSQELSPEALDTFSKAYRYFMMLPPAPDGSPRYMYADYAAHIHAWAVRN
ncbi:MAG: hypothetical protein P8181_13925, partial [bacterium]